MTVKIRILYYENYHVFKNLIDDLKNKQATIIEENMFGIELELNVNSIDEIICILEKYSKEIEITLSIYSANKVRFFITRREYGSFGNQVE